MNLNFELIHFVFKIRSFLTNVFKDIFFVFERKFPKILKLLVKNKMIFKHEHGHES